MQTEMSVGAELKRAREARGLSLQQLAGATKITAGQLAALEDNALEALPPINYVRGFLRVYATEVGLDPDDIVDRYVAQFEPEAPRAIEPTAAVPPSEPHHVPTVEPEQGRYVPAPAVETEPQEKARIPYAALAVVVLIALAAYLFLRTPDGAALTDSVPSPSEPPAVAAEPAPSRGAPAEPVTPPPDPASAPVAQTEPVIVSEIDPKPVPNPASLPRSTSAGETAANYNVSGSWTFTTEVQSASQDAFKGLQLGYRLELSQQDGRVTGTGQKMTENGQAIAAAGRTPISVDGTIKGTHLELRFTERGAQRTSGGTFVLESTENGELRGSFASDAAQSRGTLRAQRAR